MDNDPLVDNDVINLPPQIKARPRMVALTEELIVRMTKVSSLADVVYLNLHGNGLTRLKQLQVRTLLRNYYGISLYLPVSSLCVCVSLSIAADDRHAN